MITFAAPLLAQERPTFQAGTILNSPYAYAVRIGSLMPTVRREGEQRLLGPAARIEQVSWQKLLL